jgi:hypothetical protein
MQIREANAQALTRRFFFSQCGMGVGAIALQQLLAEGASAAPTDNPLAQRQPHFAAKAKSVIYLHMAGSPSQLDLFDYKPMLVKHNGENCPEEFLKGKRFAFIRGVPKMLGTPMKFAQRGPAGVWLSEAWQHLPSVLEDVAIVKSMNTEQFNHAPAQLFLHTGTQLLGGASIGAWATYGLGTVNQDLPGFVVLTSGGKTPDAGVSVWGSGFLPSVYQGVQCRTSGEPVLFLSNPPGLDRAGRRQTLDALQKLNQLNLQTAGDPETLTRIEQFELAFRMQMSVPDAMDISQESQQTLDLYGAKPGYVSNLDQADDVRTAYKGDDPTLANNCLLARRLVERGVRFVQLFDWGWDHHGVSPGEHIPTILPIKVQQIDRALTGLIKDLKQRGLLDSTLIVWGGEFGRTPMQQNNNPSAPFIGRDHHPYCFTMMLAGGGIRGGQVYGETDELGYYITENPVSIRDLQALILSQLGLDPQRLTYTFQGLEQRLVGPEGKGQVPKGLVG